MDTTNIVSLIRKKFGTYKKSGHEIQVRCPFCHTLGKGVDRRFKLYINIKKGVYNCFRCETRGKLSMLFPQIPMTLEDKYEVVESTEVEPLPRGIKLHDLQYPYNDLVFELLLDRGFSPATLDNILYFCEDYTKGDFIYGPSLIFPITQFGTYRGFQARTLYKNHTPKYISATNMDAKRILYNYDVAFSQNDKLIVTEGFFDCLKCGANAVATLGKGISDEQLRLIRLNNFKEVIFFLDKDAEKESRETAKKLALYFNTYLARPTKKDPGAMTRFEIMDLTSNKNRLERIY